jgi:hypothetical protein
MLAHSAVVYHTLVLVPAHLRPRALNSRCLAASQNRELRIPVRVNRRLTRRIDTKVSSMLQRAGEAYARMMSGQARFRVVLTM